MGGRGNKSGITRKKSAASKPAYFKETEKAVQLKMNMEDNYGYEKVVMTYVPKSQLVDGYPSAWIQKQKEKEERALVMSWEDANGNEIHARLSEKDKEYAAKRQAEQKEREESYNSLVAEAKRLGVKGARVGMKRTTLQRKINEAKGNK